MDPNFALFILVILIFMHVYTYNIMNKASIVWFIDDNKNSHFPQVYHSGSMFNVENHRQNSSPRPYGPLRYQWRGVQRVQNFLKSCQKFLSGNTRIHWRWSCRGGFNYTFIKISVECMLNACIFTHNTLLHGKTRADNAGYSITTYFFM